MLGMKVKTALLEMQKIKTDMNWKHCRPFAAHLAVVVSYRRLHVGCLLRHTPFDFLRALLLFYICL